MTNFLGLDLITSKETLEPRPETELLVKECLDVIKNYGKAVSILDIGTGSGNIAVSLTNAEETCKIMALDISEGALRVAHENASRYGVLDRISFRTGDIFDEEQTGSKFDIIVSNPPYIPSWEIATLAENVQNEPRIALDGGDDGFLFFKRIIEIAPKVLNPGGYLLMELGYNQSYFVRKMMENSGHLKDIEFIKDFAGINRICKARCDAPLHVIARSETKHVIARRP